MTNDLLHTAAELVREVLISRGVATSPEDAIAWPCYVGSEPNSPDNCITVFDTTNVPQGRTFDGEIQEQYGFQIRVRSKTYPIGKTRLLTIRQSLANVHGASVTLEDTNYSIQNFSRIGNVLSLGRDGKNSARELFTLNATFAVNCFVAEEPTLDGALLDQSGNFLVDHNGNYLTGAA